ncbi:MAG TPA: hypothetical protein VFE31_09735, partial [Opitutaceae bacterium]|nr:hypothetical protein [Opitutaceae bacterium]
MVLRGPAGDAAAMSAVEAALAGVAAALGELEPLGCWDGDSAGLEEGEGLALATAGDAEEAEGVDDGEAAPVLEAEVLAAAVAVVAAGLEEPGPPGRWEGDSAGLD